MWGISVTGIAIRLFGCIGKVCKAGAREEPLAIFFKMLVHIAEQAV